MRKFIGIAAAFAILLQPFAVQATEIITQTYSIDSFTGEVITSEGDSPVAAANYIADDCIYNSSTGYFYYTVGGDREAMISSVASGMVVSQPVYLEIKDGLNVIIYRDGEEYVPQETQIMDTGDYVVTVAQNGGEAVRPLSFTIAGSPSSRVRSYTMPDGFQITSITFNQEELPVDNASVATLDQEGDYTVTYICETTGVTYELTLTTDYTAPVLALKGVVDGRIHGPVDLSDVEANASVELYRDGEPIDFRKQITQSGRYRVVVTDQAGNRGSYDFTILLYFNADSIILLVMLIVLIAGLVIYVCRKSRRLRVR